MLIRNDVALVMLSPTLASISVIISHFSQLSLLSVREVPKTPGVYPLCVIISRARHGGFS